MPLMYLKIISTSPMCLDLDFFYQDYFRRWWPHCGYFFFDEIKSYVFVFFFFSSVFFSLRWNSSSMISISLQHRKFAWNYPNSSNKSYSQITHKYVKILNHYKKYRSCYISTVEDLITHTLPVRKKIQKLTRLSWELRWKWN